MVKVAKNSKNEENGSKENSSEEFLKYKDENDDYGADEEEQKKGHDKENKAWTDFYNIAIFILVMAVIVGASIFVYEQFFAPKPIVLNETMQYKYNEYTFTKSGPLWITEVQVGNKLIQIPLHYGPREVDYIDIIGNLDSTFDEGPIYLTFDPEQRQNNMTALAAGELSLNIVQGIRSEIIAACSKNITDACAMRPIVNCMDTDKSVIYLKESTDNIIVFQDRCIIVRAEGDNMVKAVDKLLLYWYKILPKVKPGEEIGTYELVPIE